MKVEHQSKITNQLARSRHRLLVVLSVVSLTLFLLFMVAIKQSGQRTQIIVLPDVVTEPFTISSKKVSESYIRQMADYYARLTFSTTPQSVDSQVDTLLSHVPAHYMNDVKLNLVRYSDSIKQKNIMSTFYPTDFDYNPVSKSMEIKGDFIVFLGRESIRSKKKIKIDFELENTRLWIKKIEELT